MGRKVVSTTLSQKVTLGKKRKVLGNGRQILRLGYKPLIPGGSNQLDPDGLSFKYSSS